MKTIWKDIPGYNGFYQVSNNGKVRSWRKSGQGKGKRKEPRILSESNYNDYPYVTLVNGEIKKCLRIHSLVNIVFNGKSKEEGLYTLHKDGNTKNNTPDNLYWGTAQDNANDTQRHGTVARGEKQGNSRLTKDEVLEIRAAYNLGCFSQIEMAKAYNVARRTISAIITKQNWAHI